MMMAACYANYDMSLSHNLPTQHAHHVHQHQEHSQQHQQQQHQQQQQSQHQTRISSVAELLAAAASSSIVAQQKDYSIPLHVDCSVEYELPNQPKPPAGQRIEPLLMIHPCYFRKMESQRRSPFINNMPNSTRNSALILSTSSSSSSSLLGSSSSSTSSSTSSSSTVRRSSQRQTQQQQHVITNSSTALANQQSQQQQQQQQQQQYHSQSLHSIQNSNHLLNQQIQQQHLSQQARYPIISNIQSHQQASALGSSSSSNVQSSVTSITNNDYNERAMRRATIIQTRAVNQQQQQQQYQQQQQQHQHQKQQQIPQWDKIASTSLGMISSISTHPSTTTAHHTLPSSVASSSIVPTVNLIGKTSNYNNKPVGKRDAMISGECSSNNIITNNNSNNNVNSNNNNNNSNTNNNNISNSNNNCNNTTNHLNNNRNNFSNQNNNNNNNSNNNNNNNRISNNNNITKINNGNSANCTSLIDTATNLRMWDASNSLIVHRSPMAAVPSNYQAGPETTSTSIINNIPYNSTSLSSLTSSLQQSSTSSGSSSSSASSTAALLNRNIIDNDKINGKYRQYLKSHRIHPYLMSNTSNLGSTYSQLASVTNFPHHQQMQQMSCYNV
ncbi:centrosomal and chromosomal factor-like [Condylostylus longicornis]|uniref:centrosomal and chromosomal factor-like n=1 Tax=Condylostylus longicornis TaxID=2530218 RepID=UPI00244E15C1|nr:centrosomal and chromosomal factor-like [Condylostylus longicornis]